MFTCCVLCDDEVVMGDDYQAHLQMVHSVTYDEIKDLEEVENKSRRLEENEEEMLEDSIFWEVILDKIRNIKDLVEGKIEVNDAPEDEDDDEEIVEDGQLLQMLDNLKTIVENIEDGSEEITEMDESLKLFLSEDDSQECKGSDVDTDSDNLENNEDLEVERTVKSNDNDELNTKTEASKDERNFINDVSRDKNATLLNISTLAEVVAKDPLTSVEPNPLTSCLELSTPSSPTNDVDLSKKESVSGTIEYEGLADSLALDINSNLCPKIIDQGKMSPVPLSSITRPKPQSARASDLRLEEPRHPRTRSKSRPNVRAASPRQLVVGSAQVSTRPNHLALSKPDNKQIAPSVMQLNTSLPSGKTSGGLTERMKKGTQCSALPKGWRRKEVVRKKGLSAGTIDVYYFTPDGRKVRSKPELVEAMGETLDLSGFDYNSGTMQPTMIQPRGDTVVANIGPILQAHPRKGAQCRPTAGPPRQPARATTGNQFPLSTPERTKIAPPVIELDNSPPRIENPAVARLVSLGCSVRTVPTQALPPSISITRTSEAKAPANTVVINKMARALELLGHKQGPKRQVVLELTETQIEGLWALGMQGKKV